MIKNLDELDKRFAELSAIDLKPAIGKGIELVQANAKSLCSVHNGELRNSIFADVTTEDNHIVGTCYTNKEYAPYVEFGTGKVGQASHKGISPHVPVAYTQKGWIIPVKAMSRAEAEQYKLGVLEDKDGNPIGYMTNGQAAKPFLYPALKNNEDKILEIIKEEARKVLK